jgi:hypothetical protein
LPYQATQNPPETPKNAYHLIKSELVYFIMDQRESTTAVPTDEQLQLEACRIVFGSEVLSTSPLSSTPSWLRDLIMSDDSLALEAQLGRIRSQAENGIHRLQINGKDNIFEECPLETQLHEYVKARRFLGLTATDDELQLEACNILGRTEESSSTPSDDVANFLVRLIYGSTGWLAPFRQRAHLPRSEDMADVNTRSKDPTTIDSTIHNYCRLEAELAEYVKTQRSLGIEPSDADLQKQARIIIYEFDDGWNQTAADNIDWLNAFKQRHIVSSDSLAPSLAGTSTLTLESVAPQRWSFSQPMPDFVSPSAGLSASRPGYQGPSSSLSRGSRHFKVGAFFHDANCYKRLARELGRYVASTMSRNNPNRHVPSDEELQHQARWILYDE